MLSGEGVDYPWETDEDTGGDSGGVDDTAADDTDTTDTDVTDTETTDTDAPSDSETPTDSGGCGCAQGPAPAGLWMLLAVFGLRRRAA